MQTIKCKLPGTGNPYFMYVAPAPLPGQINKWELMESRDVVEIDTGTETILAERHSWVEFPFDFMGDYICKLAYGFTEEQMKDWLLKRFNNIGPKTKIAFYLFKKVNAKQQQNKQVEQKITIGLPL